MFSQNIAESDTGWWYGGQIWHILVEFRPPYCMYTVTRFYHEIHDCHSDSDGRNIENIELSLSEILPFNLVHWLYLSVAVTGDEYCIFGRVQASRAIENEFLYMENLPQWAAEFGKLACGICKNLPQKTVVPSMKRVCMSDMLCMFACCY